MPNLHPVFRQFTHGTHSSGSGLGLAVVLSIARAHGGVLYVDEVNLLHDHLVDVLLDASAMGRVHVERDGVSHSHEACFVLIGTMNPEEGELRPQLLDRFGLTVDVRASRDVDVRVQVIRQRMAYEADPDGFAHAYQITHVPSVCAICLRVEAAAGPRRRGTADGRYHRAGTAIWPLWLPESDSLVAGGGMAGERQARGADLASRGAEGARPATQARAAVAE